MRIGNIWVYISPIWGEETPQRIDPNFFLVEGIHDVIPYARFGDDRLRGSWVVWGSKFSISHWLCWSSLQLSHYRVSVNVGFKAKNIGIGLGVWGLALTPVMWLLRSPQPRTYLGGLPAPTLLRWKIVLIFNVKTRNTLDCDQSNYSSHIPIKFGQK